MEDAPDGAYYILLLADRDSDLIWMRNRRQTVRWSGGLTAEDGAQGWPGRARPEEEREGKREVNGVHLTELERRGSRSVDTT